MDRFWNKVDKSGDCWEWTAHIDPCGYGRFGLNGKIEYAHRAVFFIEGSDIPSGMCVCHKCDNRKCVNPDHLYIGTHDDNVADKVQRGNHGFKITREDIPFIRKLIKSGETNQQIADRYGVSDMAISAIRTGRSWWQF